MAKLCFLRNITTRTLFPQVRCVGSAQLLQREVGGDVQILLQEKALNQRTTNHSLYFFIILDNITSNGSWEMIVSDGGLEASRVFYRLLAAPSTL